MVEPPEDYSRFDHDAIPAKVVKMEEEEEPDEEEPEPDVENP